MKMVMPRILICEVQLYVSILNIADGLNYVFSIVCDFELIGKTITGDMLSPEDPEKELLIVAVSDFIKPTICIVNVDQDSSIMLRGGGVYDESYRLWPCIK